MAFEGLSGMIETYLLTPERVEQLARATFSGSMRDRMFEQLAVQLENGLTLMASINDIGRRAEKRHGKNTPVAAAARAITRRMRGGESFASALKGWAPPDEVMIIDAGERGANLPGVLRLVIKGRERSRTMRGAIIGALMEPAVLLASLYAMLLLIGLWVVPPLAKAVPPAQWHGSAAGLYKASEFTQSFWVVVAPVLCVALTVVIFWSMPRWTGRARVVLDRYPPYSLYRMSRGLAWLSSFVALSGAGIPHPQALESMVRYSSRWLRERLRAALGLMRGGSNLGVALEKSGYGFPDPEVIDDILAYVDYPDFDEKMARIADQWADQGVKQIQSRARVIGFAINVLVYGLMIYLILGVNALQTQLGTQVAHVR